MSAGQAAMLLALAAPIAAGAPAYPAAAAAAAPSAASLAAARRIIAVIAPPARRMAMLSAMVDNPIAQMRAAAQAKVTDPKLRALALARIDAMPARLRPVTARHAPALAEALAHAYAREFSPAELAQVEAFAGTPAGAHFLSRNAGLAADPEVAAANHAYLAEAAGVIGAAQQALAGEMRAYVANHPQPPPK